MESKITVLGAGAWGTAVANHLSQNNINTILWSFEHDVAQEIENQKTNSRYLPDLKIDTRLKTTTDLATALNFSQFIVEAIPVKHLRSILDRAKTFSSQDKVWIMTSKGVELETFKLSSEILFDVLGYQPFVAALSGPNFAKELIKKSITASVLACKDQSLANQIASFFENEYLKIYNSNDVNGVQAGGALKNVYALTLGIMRGQEFSENSIAFMFTRCIEEMALLSERLGGHRDTIYGLSGLGDLFLTGNCILSKNFKFGKMLGQGIDFVDAGKKFVVLPEGVSTIKSLMAFAQKYAIQLPICQTTYEIIFEDKSSKNLLYVLQN